MMKCARSTCFKLTAIARRTSRSLDASRFQSICATRSSSREDNAFTRILLLSLSGAMSEELGDVCCSSLLVPTALTWSWTKEIRSWSAWEAEGSRSCSGVFSRNVLMPFSMLWLLELPSPPSEMISSPEKSGKPLKAFLGFTHQRLITCLSNFALVKMLRRLLQKSWRRLRN